MQVIIKYNDDAAITVEEVVSAAHNRYGPMAKVEVQADSPARPGQRSE